MQWLKRKKAADMTIQNEVEHQVGMNRLESLDSTNPDNLAEMEALGNALEAYEDRYGHAPLPPGESIG